MAHRHRRGTRRGWEVSFGVYDALKECRIYDSREVEALRADLAAERARAELAEQEAAGLRVDAERYRWLRSCVDVPALYVKNHPGKPRSLLAFQALDATIDIARGET